MAFHSPYNNTWTLSRPAVPFHTLFSLILYYTYYYYYSFAGCKFFAVSAWRSYSALDRRFRRVTVPRLQGRRWVTAQWRSTDNNGDRTRRIIRSTGEEKTLKTVNTEYCAYTRIMRIIYNILYTRLYRLTCRLWTRFADTWFSATIHDFRPSVLGPFS